VNGRQAEAERGPPVGPGKTSNAKAKNKRKKTGEFVKSQRSGRHVAGSQRRETKRRGNIKRLDTIKKGAGLKEKGIKPSGEKGSGWEIPIEHDQSREGQMSERQKGHKVGWNKASSQERKERRWQRERRPAWKSIPLSFPQIKPSWAEH